MQRRRSILPAMLAVAFIIVGAAFLMAQTAGKAAEAAALPVKPQGTLNQVMEGIVFPNSNVIFAVQSVNPTKIGKDQNPALSVNPLSGSYGEWLAVENSGIALAEAADMIGLPGRVCSNGKPVPVRAADWVKYQQALRDAGMAAYKAAKSKNQDAIVDVADQLTTACSDCHTAYRDKTARQGGLSARCTK